MQYTEQEHPISILWNNVSRPTGYVAIIPNIGEDVDKYNNLAQLLNCHGFVVLVLRNTATRFCNIDRFVQSAVNQIQGMDRQNKLSWVLIGTGYGTIVAQQIQKKSKCVRACISVSNMAGIGAIKLQSWAVLSQVGKCIFGKNCTADRICRHMHIPQHTYDECYYIIKQIKQYGMHVSPTIPTLVINGGADISYPSGQLARTLYNTYNEQMAENLTLLIYPDACDTPLFDQDRDMVHTDIMEFIVQNTRCRAQK